MKLRKGKIIPREDGKRIEELIGAATTGTESFSLAKMRAPPGWFEPPQTPEFDEAVLVLQGELTLLSGKKTRRLGAGEVGWIPRGTRIVYRNDSNGACEYVSVCAPAFRMELAHVEPRALRPNEVALEIAHPRGKPHRRLLLGAARKFMSILELQEVELSLALITDRAIRRLNRTWRKLDKATDVLSFPSGAAPVGAPGLRHLGDVVISLDTATRQAREHRRSVSDELSRYLAHGLLHLLGHDHHRPAQAKKMRALESRLLGRPGMLMSE